MSTPEWISIASRLPADGEVVLVKMSSGTQRLARFIASPIPRWVAREFISQLATYDFWCLAPSRE